MQILFQWNSKDCSMKIYDFDTNTFMMEYSVLRSKEANQDSGGPVITDNPNSGQLNIS